MFRLTRFFSIRKEPEPEVVLTPAQELEETLARITPETQLFAVPLEAACRPHPPARSSSPILYPSFVTAHMPLPFPVYQCLNFLDNFSLSEPGLYRIPGSLVRVKLFRARMDCGEYVNFESHEEPGTVTSLLLAFLREIPGGLVPEDIRRRLHGINSLTENAEATIRGIFESMDEPRQRVLGALVDHLKRVAAHHEVNMMTPQNLAICVFPALENPFVATLLIDRGSSLFRANLEEPVFPAHRGPRRASVLARSTESIRRAFSRQPKAAKWRAAMMQERAGTEFGVTEKPSVLEDDRALATASTPGIGPIQEGQTEGERESIRLEFEVDSRRKSSFGVNGHSLFPSLRLRRKTMV